MSAVAALTARGVWDTWISSIEKSVLHLEGKAEKRTNLEMCRLRRRCYRNQRHYGKCISKRAGVLRRVQRRKGLLTGFC